MNIIAATVRGERVLRKVARLRDPMIKADEATITRSLQGRRRAEHMFELARALGLFRAYQTVSE